MSDRDRGKSPPTTPRCIGIIGGMGPWAGLDLVQKVHAETNATKDCDHLSVLLHSHPAHIPDRSDFLLNRATENPGNVIADFADVLVQSGAEVLGVACNTAHAPRIFSRVEERLRHRAALVNMVEEVGVELSSRYAGARAVGILATTGAYCERIYPIALEARGLRVFQPSLDIQNRVVQEAITNPEYGIKAYSRPVTARATDDLIAAARELKKQGSEVVVLACTELPLALFGAAAESCGVPLIDSTRILARALIRRAAPERLLSSGSE